MPNSRVISADRAESIRRYFIRWSESLFESVGRLELIIADLDSCQVEEQYQIATSEINRAKTLLDEYNQYFPSPRVIPEYSVAIDCLLQLRDRYEREISFRSDDELDDNNDSGYEGWLEPPEFES